jgi:HEAT repeat protein
METTNCKWCGGTIFVGVARCSNCGKDVAGVAGGAPAETVPSGATQAGDAAPDAAKDQFNLEIKLLMYVIPAIVVSFIAWKIYSSYSYFFTQTPAPPGQAAASAGAKKLTDANKVKRYEACLELSGQNPPPAEDLPIVLQLLKDADENVRGACGAAIGSYGGAAGEAIPILISMLHDSSTYARLTAAESLGKIATKIPEDTLAVPALIESLQDKDAQVRRFTAVGLQALGDRAAPAIPALLTALNNPSAEVRQQIVQTLGRLVTKSADIVPALTRAARDPDSSVRSSALAALGDSGMLARPAIPVLGQMIHDKDEGIRANAVDALGKCCADADEAMPYLIEALGDRVHEVRKFAVLHLGEIGPRAKAAVPALIPILSGKEIYLREWAAEALGNIGPDAKAALPRLHQMLNEKIVSNESEAGRLPATVQTAIEKIEK